jgi:hypothetical protein
MSSRYHVLQASAIANNGQGQQVVFIVDDLADQQTLVDAAPKGSAVVHLDSDGDALQQMAEYLTTLSTGSVDGIHLFSHGASGRLGLGSTYLSAETLEMHQDSLDAITHSLADQGDILLYGCHVAGGETGLDFVHRLAVATGADVAASHDRTGAAKLGGNWVLEEHVGDVRTQSVAAGDYVAALAVTPDRPGGNILVLDGTDDYAQAATPWNTLSVGSDTITIAAWIKPENLGSPSSGDSWEIVSLTDTDSGGTTNYLGFRIPRNTGKIQVGVDNGLAWTDVKSTGEVTVNTWSHVACVLDDTNVTFYINGAEAGTGTLESRNLVGLDYLSIGAQDYMEGGANHKKQDFFDGQIDEVQVWNTALTAEQIQHWMNNVPANTETDLADFWGFEDNSTPTLINDAFVNAAPTLSDAGDTLTYTQGDNATAIDDSLTLADTDSENIASAFVTISDGYVSDEDVLEFENANGITGNWDASAGLLTLTGTATKAEYEAALESVTYRNTDTTSLEAGNRTVTWVVSDGSSDSVGVTSTIAVAQINGAPVLADDDHSLTAIEEDVADGSNSGTTVAVLVVDGSITDPNGSPVEAIAVSVVNTTNGTWQFKVGEGEWTAFDFSEGNSGAALLLDSSDSVRFVPDADWNGTVSDGITFHAWDKSSGSAGDYLTIEGNTGGTGPLSTATDTAAITVNPVNDAPSGADKTLTVTTGATLTIQTADFGFTDPDTGASLHFIAVNSIPATGTLFLDTVTDNDVLDEGEKLAKDDRVFANDIASGDLLYAAPEEAGDASFEFTVNDGDAYAASSATLTLTATAPPPSGGGGDDGGDAPQDGTETETVEGTTVTTTTTTNPDGTVTETTTVDPFDGFQEGEDDDDGDNDLSDHVLAGSTGAPAIIASLPLGVGLTSSGTTTPQTPEDALNDLIGRIEAETEAGSDTQTEMTGAGQAFLNGLPEGTRLYVNTITPTVAGATPPDQPIVITGSPSEDGTQEALVIDVSGLPSGTVLQLDGVEFAAIVGGAIVNGGAGNNIVVGDDGAQIIVLGEGDDILDGGAGDDHVGSEGGDDILIGGLGNDVITGGHGSDAAEFAGAYVDAFVNRGETVTVADAGGVDTIGEDVELLAFVEDRALTLVRPEGNAIIAGVGFDTAFYLAQNADVAEAVTAGAFASAADHFVQYGLAEGRAANAVFDGDAYLALYTDVAEAVTAGAFTSAQQHYAQYGAGEGRDPGGWFDASAYLEANPDVAEAGLPALEHFVVWGAAQGRTGIILDDGLLVA